MGKVHTVELLEQHTGRLCSCKGEATHVFDGVRYVCSDSAAQLCRKYGLDLPAREDGDDE